MEKEENKWEWREHNRAKVMQCLEDSRNGAIVTSGQSEWDILAHLIVFAADA